ncbi:hypothetical protein HNQ04_002308 [Deinococcus radiopugnans ATCC 19172]|uniref:Uncharacterized protein n=1 Tax=Deinococcus radiopugnans ATCC 19172 TaxID=585398 RepID=A0ABR6NSM7_9DEIO|nr:hypothetical protein [Deinococcus radiopugnans ATCC 19172]
MDRTDNEVAWRFMSVLMMRRTAALKSYFTVSFSRFRCGPECPHTLISTSPRCAGLS